GVFGKNGATENFLGEARVVNDDSGLGVRCADDMGTVGDLKPEVCAVAAEFVGCFVVFCKAGLEQGTDTTGRRYQNPPGLTGDGGDGGELVACFACVVVDDNHWMLVARCWMLNLSPRPSPRLAGRGRCDQ